ncbi:hypothetical protein [Chromobacterium violaceum]|uniref:hypothetical protein n=1 Tax=Chromobacterium violaceum TaxID=536 RepID=UPI000AAA12F7|nr:hypothetical protein [Chromobacterium violaceum]
MKSIFEKIIRRVEYVLKGECTQVERVEKRKHLASVCSTEVTISLEMEEKLEQQFLKVSEKKKAPCTAMGQG